MPTTTAQAFDAVGLRRKGIVKWGTNPRESAAGVYIVSLTKSLHACDATLSEAPLDPDQFKRWLDRCPKLTLDLKRPNVEDLMNRIQGFWIPDEAILYIGRADSLCERIYQYYCTPIAARCPHSGGYFLKLLSNLDQLWVHYAEHPDPDLAEDEMLRQFCENVSEDSKEAIADGAHPFPFANLEWPQHVRKMHGILGAREPRTKVNSSGRSASKKKPTVRSLVAQQGACYPTQRVTAADLRSRQIRIPSRSSCRTKTLFPSQKDNIVVELRGRLLPASWDPRTGPDRKRSGALRVGRVLLDLVREDELLLVSIGEDGVICID